MVGQRRLRCCHLFFLLACDLFFLCAWYTYRDGSDKSLCRADSGSMYLLVCYNGDRTAPIHAIQLGCSCFLHVMSAQGSLLRGQQDYVYVWSIANRGVIGVRLLSVRGRATRAPHRETQNARKAGICQECFGGEDKPDSAVSYQVSAPPCPVVWQVRMLVSDSSRCWDRGFLDTWDFGVEK